MNPYLLQTAGKIVSGRHTLEKLADHLPSLGAVKSAWILSQPSMKRQGSLDQVIRQLEKCGISAEWSLDIKPEPTADNIEEVYRRMKESRADCIIAIGGGSVLDAAKLLSVLATNDMRVRDMLGIEQIPRAGLPTVLIPTTSGTGSEVTPNAIVTLPDEELKIGVVSRFLFPQLVILDPALTISLPRPITAATGMDAFTHALESFISNKANPFSDMFALESIRKLSGSIVRAYQDGNDLDARENMLIGSMYGGMALSCAGTAAVHAMAYPIGGKFNVPHGVANSMLLPHVMEFNLDAIVGRLAEVSSAIGGDAAKGETARQKAESVLLTIQDWTKELEIPQDLASFGVRMEDVPELAEAASKVTRLMGNNPKEMVVDDIKEIYRKLL